MKIGGVEVAREKWDEQDPSRNLDDDMDASPDQKVQATPPRSILPDWTRSPLPVGAPPANPPPPPAAAAST